MTLWMLPALPFAGFLVLALMGSRLPRAVVGAVGASSVGAAAIFAAVLASSFRGTVAVTHGLGTWFAAEGLHAEAVLRLDPLALVMVLVVTGVGFLIHLYAVELMRPDPGYVRFFASMNLFVAAMLLLVLADDLLLLYLGWEGVGLCSYLLIGFWYEDPRNGRAARKAFIVTRVGDAALAVGIILVYWQLGTLRISDVLSLAPQVWRSGSDVAVLVALLLLIGAIGKSAQLPLHTWLPDAMAGPTPVSALIHAATMVTAGVYLVARMRWLFELAPGILNLTAVIGAATLLVAGVSALFQRDIKRVLAYSTISQVGYMFLALGVGAWSAAIFHLVTHAFFKALLFLGAGAVILALDDEHDLLRMGGLRRDMPLVFAVMLAGGASLAGLPLVTAGFYSKEAILRGAWIAQPGGAWLWGAGTIGVVLTGLYTFRLIVLAFLGDRAVAPSRRAGGLMLAPMVVLAALSLVAGGLPVMPFLGRAAGAVHGGITREVVAGAATIAGIALAWLYRGRRAPLQGRLPRLWRAGWGFDDLYDFAFVRPTLALARVNRGDAINAAYDGLAWIARRAHAAASGTQTGRLGLYAAAVALGAVAVLAVVILR